MVLCDLAPLTDCDLTSGNQWYRLKIVAISFFILNCQQWPNSSGFAAPYKSLVISVVWLSGQPARRLTWDYPTRLGMQERVQYQNVVVKEQQTATSAAKQFLKVCCIFSRYAFLIHLNPLVLPGAESVFRMFCVARAPKQLALRTIFCSSDHFNHE